VKKPLDPHRKHLLAALQADLIGPYDPETGDEVLALPPLRWYLTGFLVPEGMAHAPDAISGDADEELESGDDEDADVEGRVDPGSKQQPILPSSVGLSVLLPARASADAGPDQVEVEVSWGEYLLRSTSEEITTLCRARGMNADKYLPNGQRKQPAELWERARVPRRPVVLDLGKAQAGKLVREPVPGAPGIVLEYRVETITAADARILRIGEDGHGARALSVFLVNARALVTDRERDGRGHSRELNGQSLFQVEFCLRAGVGLLPRPDAHFANSQDFDDRMVDLQFRNEVEWVVGHGIAARAIGRDGDAPAKPAINPAVGAVAVWLPHTSVARVQPSKIPGVTVAMTELASLADAAAVQQHLGALPAAYALWIAAQTAIPLAQASHRDTQTQLVARAREAQARITDGIDLLASDPQLRQAFCWANEAMAAVARRRLGKKDPAFAPKWHLFQLAFLLLNLRGISDPEHEDRDKVELLFFPTGGGKTEAYLGVIATTLLLRRMRGQDRADGGLGVAVILRYTLRLLTLDQLERAAALICSLELLRRQHPRELGLDRYAIGLWVGRSGTPNTMAEAAKQITDYRGATAESRGSPFPLVKCPWCETEIEARGMDTLPRRGEPTRTVVVCANRECEFGPAQRGAADTKVGELPVLFVDEHVYNELPAFLISTVDKFAMLTHRGQAGKLFGRVHSYTDQQGQPRRFWSGGDGDDHVMPAASAEALPEGLRPPDLVIQDELHLISGPLGTMVGLFETLVEELCHRTLPAGGRVGPKILAATATVRRASSQVQALYARKADQTKLFPPQGVDAWMTFFAERDMDANERMYVGLAATGRSLKRILLQSYLALLGAAEFLQDDPELGAAGADPYKTLVGYFNSLRELGGMRRIVDDDVYTRVRKLDQRTPHDARGPGRTALNRWLSKRDIGDPIELTSRVRTSDLTRDKARLATAFHDYAAARAAGTLDPDALKPVDVLLASNMISVGLDVTRLGLMVVAGQPKTTSEYIQATSRVGRDDERPGFVLTVYNVHKPRDRSHYEHFIAYHESFYRYVEAQSVTPFSLPALDRSLASVVVGMVRHLGSPRLAAPKGAGAVDLLVRAGERVSEVLADRARAQPDAVGTTLDRFVADRSKNILDKWRTIVTPTAHSRGSSVAHCYSPFEEKRARATALLRTPENDATLDIEIPRTDPHYPFVAPTSMRDVEPSVAIWVRRRPQEDQE
jgi:hypothetical protein